MCIFRPFFFLSRPFRRRHRKRRRKERERGENGRFVHFLLFFLLRAEVKGRGRGKSLKWVFAFYCRAGEFLFFSRSSLKREKKRCCHHLRPIPLCLSSEEMVCVDLTLSFGLFFLLFLLCPFSVLSKDSGSGLCRREKAFQSTTFRSLIQHYSACLLADPILK